MHGFRLTQEAKDEGFSGGSVNCNTLGHAFDVGEAITQGNGEFYTDDPGLAEVLRSYPSLEVIPEDEVPTDTSTITPVDVPGSDVLQAPDLGPWQPQNPPEQPDAGTGEIPAEHADDPGTPDEALDQGASVSGLVGSRFGTSGSSELDEPDDDED